MDEPQLGLATTAQMLTELKTRFEMEAFAPEPLSLRWAEDNIDLLLEELPERVLSYRTVDHE